MSLLDGLQARWKLDGNALDSHGNNDALAVGVTWVVDTKFGTVGSFDGQDDYVDTQSEALGNGLFMTAGRAFSVRIWGKANNTQGTLLARASATGANRTFQVFFQTAVPVGKPAVYLRGTQNNYDWGYTDNAWHQIVVTWDGTTGKVYGDNDREATLTVGTAAEEAGQRIIIGARTNGTGFLFTGLLAEAAIWERAISKEESDDLYLNNFPEIVSRRRRKGYFYRRGVSMAGAR